MTTHSDWNPDQACEEIAALSSQADQITSQSHYQEPDASADSLHTSSASTSQPTDTNQSIQE